MFFNTHNKFTDNLSSDLIVSLRCTETVCPSSQLIYDRLPPLDKSINRLQQQTPVCCMHQQRARAMGYLSTNAYGRIFNTCSQLCAPLCAGAASPTAVAGLMLSSFNVAAGQSRKRGVEERGQGEWGVVCVLLVLFLF